jgi:AcrR family transcriptional regulator
MSLIGEPISFQNAMPKLAEQIKVARRQRLIDAAWRCLAAYGFRSLTVDAVCTEAGVSKGAFYIYFDKKQDLLLALLEDEAAAIDAVMSQLGHADLSGIERLRRFARAMIERGDDPSQLQIRADLWAEISTSDEVRDAWIEVVRARREGVRRWIDESVSSGEMLPVPANAFAAILLALSDGLLLHAAIDPTGFRWGNVRRALDAMLEGVSA